MSHSLQLLEQVNQMRSKLAECKEKNIPTKYTDKTINMMETMIYNANGDYTTKGKISLQEAITTTDTMKLIPHVIEGKLREAAEPEYLGTRFFQKIKVDGGSSAVYVIPVVGELTSGEVGEGAKYNTDSVEFNTLENATLEIRVKKVGIKVAITEEALSDSAWDILGLTTRKMGQATARFKEELIFHNFSQHGHVVFDNILRQQNPYLGTTGLGKDGQYNDTLSVEDFLDLSLTLMGQGFNPTDVIMHPLIWVVFARNSMIGNGLTYGALGGNFVHPNGGIQGSPAAFGMANSGDGQKFIMTPEQVQNRLPMPMNINLSPWVKFDKTKKAFDMYCVDRNEVGIIAQREELSTDNWVDPERDIKMMKCKERYGIGINNNGRAITVAKNIAVAASYPATPVVNITNTPAN